MKDPRSPTSVIDQAIGEKRPTEWILNLMGLALFVTALGLLVCGLSSGQPVVAAVSIGPRALCGLAIRSARRTMMQNVALRAMELALRPGVDKDARDAVIRVFENAFSEKPLINRIRARREPADSNDQQVYRAGSSGR